MFGLQTLTCLHEIPVVRSSTTKLQDVYSKAKNTNTVVRTSCNLAESIAEKTLTAAFNIANPMVKPFCGPVSKIDDYAAGTLRHMELKYPVIVTPAETVVNAFHAKVEPVRNIVNTVKNTANSRFQHSKDTVSNVTTAAINKASGVAESVLSFCEARVKGVQHRGTRYRRKSSSYIRSTVDSSLNYILRRIQPLLFLFRVSLAGFLLNLKKKNDVLLNTIKQTSFLNTLIHRSLILASNFLENIIGLIQAQHKKSPRWETEKQHTRYEVQTQSTDRKISKSTHFSAISESVVNEAENDMFNISNTEFTLETNPYYSNVIEGEDFEVQPTTNSLSELEYVNQNDTSKTSFGNIESEHTRVFGDETLNLDNNESLEQS